MFIFYNMKRPISVWRALLLTVPSVFIIYIEVINFLLIKSFQKYLKVPEVCLLCQ